MHRLPRRLRRIIAVIAILLFAAAMIYPVIFGDIDPRLVRIAGWISGAFGLIMGVPELWDRFGRDSELQPQRPAGAQTPQEYLHHWLSDYARQETQFVPLAAGAAIPLQYGLTHETRREDLDDIAEAVEKCDQRFVLIGDPGAGKSTALRKLMAQAARDFLANPQQHPLPLWLNLGLSGAPPKAENLLDWIWRTQAFLDGGPGPRLAQNALWLFMDGLNEMPLETRKARAADLARFLEAHPHLPVVVTCRVSEYETRAQQERREHADDEASAELAAFREKLPELLRLPLAEVTVFPLDDERIQNFIRRRGADETLWPAIRADDALLRLARNPYTLVMLIGVYTADKALPRELGQLYGLYLRRAYNDYTAERTKLASPNTPLLRLPFDALEGALKRLAYRMIVDGKGTSAEVKWAQRVIGRQTLKNGINLGVLLAEGGTVRFFHQSLQGWLAVERLSRRLSAPTWWEQRKVSTRDLMIQIGNYGPVGAPAVDALVALLRNSVEIREGPYVAWALGAIGDYRGIDPLIDVLDAADKINRAGAISGLIMFGSVAVKPLVIALPNLKPTARNAAITALHEIGSATVLPLIAGFSDNDERVNLWVGIVMGRLGDPRATQILVRGLADEGEDVLAWVVTALVSVGSAAVKPLMIALESLKPRARAPAITTLDKIGADIVLPMIEELLDKNECDRFWAAVVLGILGKPHGVDVLVSGLNTSDENAGVWAVKALVGVGTAAVQPLTTAFAVMGDSSRARAILVFEEIGLAAVAPLISILRESDEKMHFWVAVILGRLGDTESAETLLRQHSNLDADAETWALGSLIRLGPAAIEALIQALQNVDVLVVARSCTALGQISDARAVQPLARLLTDTASRFSNNHVYYYAADALENIGTGEARAVLTRWQAEHPQDYAEWQAWKAKQRGS